MAYIFYDDYLKKLYSNIDAANYHFLINHYMKIIKSKKSYKIYEQELDKFPYLVTVLFAMDKMNV